MVGKVVKKIVKKVSKKPVYVDPREAQRIERLAKNEWDNNERFLERETRARNEISFKIQNLPPMNPEHAPNSLVLKSLQDDFATSTARYDELQKKRKSLNSKLMKIYNKK